MANGQRKSQLSIDVRKHSSRPSTIAPTLPQSHMRHVIFAGWLETSLLSWLATSCCERSEARGSECNAPRNTASEHRRKCICFLRPRPQTSGLCCA